jgi:hypothetical protein
MRQRLEAVATTALHESREVLVPLMESPDTDIALHHRCFLRILDRACTDGRLTIVLPRCGRQWRWRANAMRMMTPRDVVCSARHGTQVSKAPSIRGSDANFASPPKIGAYIGARLENAFDCQARKIWDQGLIQGT